MIEKCNGMPVRKHVPYPTLLLVCYCANNLVYLSLHSSSIKQWVGQSDHSDPLQPPHSLILYAFQRCFFPAPPVTMINLSCTKTPSLYQELCMHYLPVILVTTL